MTLTVTDDDGGIASDTLTVTVTKKVNIIPIDDSFTDQRIWYRSYGSANTLMAYNSTRWDRYIWLKFDVSEVSAAAVTSAILKLHVDTSWGMSSPENREFGAYLGEDGWDEMSINWSNQPGMVADPEDTVISPMNGSVIELDVIDLVTSEADGDDVLTVVIKSEEMYSSDFLSAYSKENPDELQPYLEIES